MRLGIDIGGTKTAAVLLHPDGRVAALRTALSGRGARDVVDVAADLARQVMAAAGGQLPESVGVCMPGLVEPDTGWVRHSVNLGVVELDLAGALGAALGCPVTIDNDVKAAGLGADQFLARDVQVDAPASVPPPEGRTLAYLNVGTGLAAAIIRDGDVLRGPNGSLGEIGHLPIAGSQRCGCGQIGCLETLISGAALERLWPPEQRVGRNPFAAARGGDRLAEDACRHLCSGLFLAVQVLVLASGADRIVIGGGLTALGADLEDGLRAEISRRAAASEFVASLQLADKFEISQTDVPLAALGAALLPSTSISGVPSCRS